MPTMKVNGMHCSNCSNSVESAVKAIPGIKSAKVDLAKKELTYETASAVPVELIMTAISDLGFEPEKPVN